MVKLCVLDSCSTNSYLLKPRDGILHRFPTDPFLRQKWEHWVQDVGGPNCKDFKATKSTHLLCNKHFKPSDYLRKKLSFQAIPSVSPKPSDNMAPSRLGGSTGVINSTHSWCQRRSLLKSNYTKVSGSVNGSSLNTSMPLPRLQPNTDQKNTNPAVMKSPINGESIRDSKQQRRTESISLQVLKSSDFECPVKAQKYLKLASDETEKTKHKLMTMQLKYVRAMKRINTLTEILNQFKEERDPVDSNIEIKVCSSCRKVNVYH